MAPIARLGELPVVEARRVEGPIQALRELLDARVQGPGAHGDRDRLEDAGARMRLHQRHQPDQGRARHQAIGVEHDQVAVGPSPATAEIRDAAALAIDREPAASIEDPSEAVHLAAEVEPSLLFAQPDRRIVGIGEHEEVELLQAAGLGQRAVHRAQPGEDAVHVLVEDRHHQGGRRERVGNRNLCAAEIEGIAAAQLDAEPREHRPEAEADTGKQDGEERDQRALERRETACVEHVEHQRGADRRRQEDQQRQQQAAPSRRRGERGVEGFVLVHGGLLIPDR